MKYNDDKLKPVTITVAYCPPRHNNKKEHFENLFKTIFISGANYNAKLVEKSWANYY